MNKIVLGGIDFSDIRKNFSYVQKDAAEFISNAVEEIAVEFKKLKEASGDILQAESIAKNILEILSDIRFVSAATNVEYYLPYYDEWGDSEGEVFSRMLEDIEFEKYSKVISKLQEEFEEAER